MDLYSSVYITHCNTFQFLLHCFIPSYPKASKRDQMRLLVLDCITAPKIEGYMLKGIYEAQKPKPSTPKPLNPKLLKLKPLNPKPLNP